MDQDDKKEAFLNKASDLRREKMEGYEDHFGFEVYAQEIPPEVKDKAEKQTLRARQGSDLMETEVEQERSKYVQLGTVDAEGNRIFDASDRSKLGKCSNKFIEPLYEKVMELSNYSEEDLEELGLQ